MKFLAMVLPEGEAAILVESLPARAWRFIDDVPDGGLQGLRPRLRQAFAEGDFGAGNARETPAHRNARLAGAPVFSE